MKSEFTKIAYDTKLARPGCAIVQASMGCDPAVSHAFDTDLWLLAPTPDMAVYPLGGQITLEQLVEITNQRNGRSK
jgi:hypothetical protein